MLLAAGLAAALLWPSPPERVVLIVLDTVRSDRMSACGWHEPSTPHLEALEGALACDAYAPGSWTLPSHASFFTGLWPDQHGAHSITSGIDNLAGGGNRARPLTDQHITLAEIFQERGYTTALFSANPVLSDPMGLTQGFDHVERANSFGDLHGQDFQTGLDDFLDTLPEGNLFAVINIADAHMPWSSDWHPDYSKVAGQPRYSKTDPNSDWGLFVSGAHPKEETLLELVQASYSEAVWRSDQNMAFALEALDCPSSSCRVVITSDHGEFLGEHQLLDHGHYVFDENQRVPLWTNAVDELPSPVSAMEAYWLLLEGRLGGEGVHAMAWPHTRRCARTNGRAFCNSSAALWTATGKQMWIDGTYYRGDDLEPLERSSVQILDLAGRVERDRGDGDVPPEVMELLKAAGYVD